MANHFLRRQADGTVRVRMKFLQDEAALIEEAAGTTSPLTWLHQTINQAAADKVQRDRARRPIAPPEEQA